MALETYQSTLSGAQMDAAIIEMNERNSEAYAVGKRGGVDVGTTDPTYHNNSKYYSEVAQQAAGSTPYIGANGNWYEWDSSTQQFVDTGVKAEGQDGEDGTGIQSITKTGTSGNIDTYTITLEDGRTSTFTVTNGTSIASITKTSTEGKVDTYTVTLTDGSTTTFTVTNGNDGENASVTVTEYQASNDGTTIPTGTWTTTIPSVQGGQYLWTRFTWNVGTYSYIVARQGVNGTGTGDMEKSVYDADNTVANAGGIVNYVDENGGKIDHIQINGVEQTITDKTVNLNVRPDLGTIDLSSSWSGSASPYSQTVTVTGATITANSKVDIQPDSTMIAQLINDGCNALYISNNNGTLTAYAIGEHPTTALIGVQVSVTEVVA